jgi:hypothetical protein
MIKEDFTSNNFQFGSNIDPAFQMALSMLATGGHILSGHKKFTGNPFPETSQLDIENAIFKNPTLARVAKETVTNEILATRNWSHELLKILTGAKKAENSNIYDHNTDKFKYADPKTGEILWGFNLNRNHQIPNTQSGLLSAIRGFTFGCLMDSDNHRDTTVKKFQSKTLTDTPFDIGNGTCEVAHIGNLRKRGHSLEELAGKFHDEDFIQELYKQHCLVEINELQNGRSYNSELSNVFIRKKEGFGCCDDLTTLGIGFLHYGLGPEEALTAYISSRNADYIDTFDKVSAFPMSGGSDEYIGEELLDLYVKKRNEGNANIISKILSKKYNIEINSNEVKNISNNLNTENVQEYLSQTRGKNIDISNHAHKFLPEKLITQDELSTIIYFGAKNNTPSISGSSSVRRFEELSSMIDDSGNRTGNRMTATDAHLKYLMLGEETQGLQIGFHRTPSEVIYGEIARPRLEAFIQKGLFPEPKYMTQQQYNQIKK